MWQALVFPVKLILSPQRPSVTKKFWSGALWREHKLYALLLPEHTENAVVKKIKNYTKDKIKFHKFTKQQFAKDLQLYFSGELKKLKWPYDLSGCSDLHVKIFDALEKVPYGKTIDYTGLASLAGVPEAVRAVGTALAKNRLPLIIPCHRVIKKGGALGSFSGGFGPKLKALMLAIEGSAK